MTIKATSLKLDDELWYRVKLDALRKRMTITAYVEEALREKLTKGARQK